MRYLFILLGIFAGEYKIKQQVEEQWRLGEDKEILGGRILLRKTYNKGMALNAGESRQPLVAAVSVSLTAFFTVLFLGTLGTRGLGTLKTGLAILLGGAYSNTYDRVRRKYVVDYFSFGVKNPRIRQIVFNLADFAIVIGTLITVLAAEKQPEGQASQSGKPT